MYEVHNLFYRIRLPQPKAVHEAVEFPASHFDLFDDLEPVAEYRLEPRCIEMKQMKAIGRHEIQNTGIKSR